MNWLQVVQLLSQFNMDEIKALVTQAKVVADSVKELQKPGNDRADTVKLMRELAKALNSAADVLDPTNK